MHITAGKVRPFGPPYLIFAFMRWWYHTYFVAATTTGRWARPRLAVHQILANLLQTQTISVRNSGGCSQHWGFTFFSEASSGNTCHRYCTLTLSRTSLIKCAQTNIAVSSTQKPRSLVKKMLRFMEVYWCLCPQMHNAATRLGRRKQTISSTKPLRTTIHMSVCLRFSNMTWKSAPQHAWTTRRLLRTEMLEVPPAPVGPCDAPCPSSN